MTPPVSPNNDMSPGARAARAGRRRAITSKPTVVVAASAMAVVLLLLVVGAGFGVDQGPRAHSGRGSKAATDELLPDLDQETPSELEEIGRAHV